MRRLILRKYPSVLRNNEVFVSIGVLLIICFVFQLWVNALYLQSDFGTKIGWKAADQVQNNPFGDIGVHSFSDFSTMALNAKQDNPWLHPNNYPPFAVSIFLMFTFFSKPVGLALWLLISVVLMILPTLVANRAVNSTSTKTLFILIVAISSPFIATLDRGNIIAFLPILLFLSYSLFHNQKYALSGILFGLAISIKVYPLLLAPYFFKKKSFSFWFAALITISATSFVSSSLFGNAFKILSSSFLGISGFNSMAAEKQPMLFSANGFLNNTLIYFLGVDSKLSDFIVNNSILLSMALYIGIVFVFWNDKPEIRFITLLYALQLIPQISYTYTRVWAIIALAVLVRSGLHKFNPVWLTIILLTMTPLVVWLDDSINLFPTLAFWIFIQIILLKAVLRFNVKWKSLNAIIIKK